MNQSILECIDRYYHLELGYLKDLNVFSYHHSEILDRSIQLADAQHHWVEQQRQEEEQYQHPVVHLLTNFQLLYLRDTN